MKIMMKKLLCKNSIALIAYSPHLRSHAPSAIKNHLYKHISQRWPSIINTKSRRKHCGAFKSFVKECV